MEQLFQNLPFPKTCLAVRAAMNSFNAKNTLLCDNANCA